LGVLQKEIDQFATKLECVAASGSNAFHIQEFWGAKKKGRERITFHIP
jgi:hypothetical protein